MTKPALGLMVAWMLIEAGGAEARGQSFLQRLAEQLQSAKQAAAAPAPARPAPPPPPQPLPPPREPAAVPALAPGTPALGVRVVNVTEEAVTKYQLGVRQGALVTAIDKGSSAERAGVAVGAVIVAVNGSRVDSPEDLMQAMRSASPGQQVELTLYEGKRLVRKRLVPDGSTAGALPAARDPTTASRGPVQPPAAPVPSRSPSQPASPLPTLERELSGSSRPLLGRLGKILDRVVTQAQAIEPLPDASPATVTSPPTAIDRTPGNPEIRELRRDLDLLLRKAERLQEELEQFRKEGQALRERIESMEVNGSAGKKP